VVNSEVTISDWKLLFSWKIESNLF